MKLTLTLLLALGLVTTACKKGGTQGAGSDSTAAGTTETPATPAAPATPAVVGAAGYKSLLENWSPDGYTKASDYFSETVHPSYSTNLYPGGGGNAGASSIIVTITEYNGDAPGADSEFATLANAVSTFTSGNGSPQAENQSETEIAGHKVFLVPIKGLRDGHGHTTNTLFLLAVHKGSGKHYTIKLAVGRKSAATDWAAAEADGRRVLEHILSQNVQ